WRSSRGLLIAFPNVDDAVRESRTAQKRNPKTQESQVPHTAFLLLSQEHFCLFFRSIRILHGRLSKKGIFSHNGLDRNA
ncbi:hypothetical protein, partial [Bradyrhizobium uaiense]|uniref:hypothetical protein n=1 Tax=Bradyrhizobium uaiense TaxID=2594946 RepID=UPI0019D63501